MNFNGLHGDLYDEDDIPDISEENEGFSQDRPWFSKNQIRNVDELKPGMTVISYHYSGRCSGQGVCFYRIEDNPYEENDNWRIKVSEIEKGKVIFTNDIFLADYSVVPYNTGFWNHRNCLLKTRSKKTKSIRLPKDLRSYAA